jgi:hypothetical protein
MKKPECTHCRKPPVRNGMCGRCYTLWRYRHDSVFRDRLNRWRSRPVHYGPAVVSVGDEERTAVIVRPGLDARLAQGFRWLGGEERGDYGDPNGGGRR